MAENEILFDVKTDIGSFEKKIARAQTSLNRLISDLEALKDVEIGITVNNRPIKKWYQFWK